MADIEYDSGDEYHDGGWEVDPTDADLTMDELEGLLEEWEDNDLLLVDIEGDEDFYS